MSCAFGDLVRIVDTAQGLTLLLRVGIGFHHSIGNGVAQVRGLADEEFVGLEVADGLYGCWRRSRHCMPWPRRETSSFVGIRYLEVLCGYEVFGGGVGIKYLVVACGF